jgi:succinate---hydroxymethylglutarate CoA-transferase
MKHPRAGKMKLVAPAVMYNGQRMPVTRPPPYLSQHTDEVCVPSSHQAYPDRLYFTRYWEN